MKGGASRSAAPATPTTGARFGRVAPALVALLAAALAIHRIEDFDVWFHLAAGRLMVATGTWPAGNTFALTGNLAPYYKAYRTLAGEQRGTRPVDAGSVPPLRKHVGG